VNDGERRGLLPLTLGPPPWTVRVQLVSFDGEALVTCDVATLTSYGDRVSLDFDVADLVAESPSVTRSVSRRGGGVSSD
jgi:hypothetical protein